MSQKTTGIPGQRSRQVTEFLGAQSLRRRGAELGVWQVGSNGLVFAPLQLGRQDGAAQVEVLAGLEPGAQVVLQPPADPAALRRYRLQEAKP